MFSQSRSFGRWGRMSTEVPPNFGQIFLCYDKLFTTHWTHSIFTKIQRCSCIMYITSVSETIRKPLLVKAQTAFLKKQKRNNIWRKTIFNMADWVITRMWHVALESQQWIHQVAAPCSVTRSSGIMTLNSPGGNTLQCGRWLWDDMPLNSPKRAPYWNYSTSGFDFDHITAAGHVILHQSPKFYRNQTTMGRKKWRNVDFQDGGSHPSWVLEVQ